MKTSLPAFGLAAAGALLILDRMAAVAAFGPICGAHGGLLPHCPACPAGLALIAAGAGLGLIGRIGPAPSYHP